MHKHPYAEYASLMEQAGRFFPDFSDEQRVRWIAAKRYVEGRFTMPIGERAVDNPLPDFLRALPRPVHLTMAPHSVGDYVRELRRIVEGKLL